MDDYRSKVSFVYSEPSNIRYRDIIACKVDISGMIAPAAKCVVLNGRTGGQPKSCAVLDSILVLMYLDVFYQDGFGNLEV